MNTYHSSQHLPAQLLNWGYLCWVPAPNLAEIDGQVYKCS